MGSPAVSRFLYEANIANKIRKSSECLAKKKHGVYPPRYFVEECVNAQESMS